MKSFSSSAAFAATTLLQTAWCQLLQECFLHSSETNGMRYGKYSSDLPLLELKYDPAMEISSIIGMLDSAGDLTGVGLEHTDPMHPNVILEGNIIGRPGVKENALEI